MFQIKCVTHLVFVLLLGLFAGTATLAQEAKPVVLERSGADWVLKVGGEPFFVKGFTWSHTPVGYKYDYDLYALPPERIKAALARDMTLMRAAGCNTLRGQPPVEWMTYIHDNYGMHFIVNEYCGRYGLLIDGNWVAHTDYSDPRTRQVIIDNWKELAARYKGVRGVLMYALGNENNYGLEWQSFEIENLPVGERHAAKAKYLYSLFNEIAKAIKEIDPARPIGIVNGDLQYLDLIVSECPDIDYIGVNAYRGKTFSDLFKQVREKLDKPVVFAEAGCDAYNAKEKREDQDAQAEFIAEQWRDMYANAAGNGGEGNCLGALVFQWADEWWKHGQQVRLDIHDTTASWRHEAFYDAAPGIDNMNEEWFGVCAIHRTEINGAHVVTPRVAYYVLKHIWSAQPYNLGGAGIEKLFSALAYAGQVKAEADKPQRLPMPAVVYNGEGGEELWAPSGYMGNTGAVRMNPDSTDNPRAGQKCLEVQYSAGGNWAGVVWQHPANDWGASPGGFDLTGSTKLTFWARGKDGGEKVKFEAGIYDSKAAYPDSAKITLGEVVLGTEWKRYEVSLAGLDLTRIKSGFCWVVAGQGKPLTFYLDDIQYE